METKRLIVRRFKPEDWNDLYEYLSIPEVVKYEPYYTFTEEECKEAAKERSEASYFWAVCLKENKKMIGHIYFDINEPKDFRTWEIGYVFNPDYYGKGYATEAARRILQYGFEDEGAHRIIAHANINNTASWKLLVRLAMRREGCMLQKSWFKKTSEGKCIWNDAYKYAILEQEWKK